MKMIPTIDIIFVILISLMCLLFLSCKQIILWRYGIHEPRKETPESIRKFLAKQDFPNENIFIFRDSAGYMQYLRDSVCRHNLLGTLFYSPKGLLVTFKDTSQCQWAGGFQVSTFKKDTLYHVDTNRSFAKLMSGLKPLSGETTLDTACADYYAVVTWSVFLGKYNKRLFTIREAISEQQEVTVIPVFINVDKQTEWNLSDNQGLAIRDD